jgi:alpha-L-arabinofuranosidase
VNVIAPIMTEPGGPAWRQTTFFPFSLTSRLANGSTLDVKLTSDVHEPDLYGTVDTVDAVATHDRETGQTAVFLVNRSQSEEASIAIDLSALGTVTLLDAQTLAEADVHAKNTLAEKERVGLKRHEFVVIDDRVTSVILPPVSGTVLSFV